VGRHRQSARAGEGVWTLAGAAHRREPGVVPQAGQAASDSEAEGSGQR
jgi:hypothetical protein